MTQSPTKSTWSAEDVIAVLRDLAQAEDLPAHLATGEIKPQDTVDTLGIDSLGGAFLIERLEEMSGTPMPDDFLDLSDNVAVIAERLTALAQKAG